VFYYAMEYLDGMPLDELIGRYGPMPESRAIHVLLQICGSLGEAHEIGLIHRDIKPANIMLNRRGGMFDVVKVLDFGLVKAIDAKRQVTMTADGAIAGTPQYMSPESIETPELVDARSDIYAIGAVGYFLLTGGPLFDGETVMEVCMKQVNFQPESISQRTGRSVCAELEAAIMQCLEKDRDRRPANVRQLADAISGAPAPPWTRTNASSWWSNVVDRGAATVASTDNNRGSGISNSFGSAEETMISDQTGKKTI
jgi:serine/threonine protein kinase